MASQPPSHAEAAVAALGLTKAFGTVRAVDGLDLVVPRGQVYGLLGPNGAGKTTTVRMLATLTRPDAGEARVLGHDLVREADAIRRSISLTGQLATVDEDLTGAENLVLLARLLGHGRRRARSRASELLERFELGDAAGRQVKTYSGGMRRRLDVAASLLARPQLLFLDEPTTGLDPRSRREVWAMVRELVAEGTTVLLTTQYLEEADQLADRIAVVDRGRVVAEGTPAELRGSIGAGVLELRLVDPARREEAARIAAMALGLPLQPGTDPSSLSAAVGDVSRATELLAELARAGIGVSAFTLDRPSLDEVFLALTGHPTDDTTEVQAA